MPFVWTDPIGDAILLAICAFYTAGLIGWTHDKWVRMRATENDD